MPIDPRYIVNLSGKLYPLYGGILAEAHERGLRSIRTELIQVPSEENGNTAIVKAVVEMDHPKVDGALLTFEGYGDASPRNVSTRMATALIRFAETRGKGRALRDAINCGDTMAEELPDLHEERTSAPTRAEPATPAARPPARHEPGFEEHYVDGSKTHRRADLVGYAIRAKEAAGEQGIRYEDIDPLRATNEQLVAFGRAIRPKLAVVKAVADGKQGATEVNLP